MTSATPVSKKSLRFRARSFVAFALSPEAPMGNWLRALDRWIENSPGFFNGRPVVLDLNTLKLEAAEIAPLVGELASRGIRIYAIEAPHLSALGDELPPLLRGARSSVITESPDAVKQASQDPGPPAEKPAPVGALIVETPVRSGQSLFHPEGDVIVMGSVGSGSEIIAGGSVHVYGTLRGRAFAGATGNPKSRIFCLRNEAELLAIDGLYRTADDMDPACRGKPVQTFLEDGVIWVTPLE